MDIILHVIGFCPDNSSHIELMDIIAAYYGELTHLVQWIRMKFNIILK